MRSQHTGMAALAGATLVLLAMAACEREPPAPPERYRVRGLVRQLPAPDAARGEIYVRHEAIPGFKNADGEVVGMESMSMPFPLPDPGLVAGVEVGDRVELEFEVDWHGGNPLEVVAVEKLPAATRLAFEAEEAGAGEAGAGEAGAGEAGAGEAP